MYCNSRGTGTALVPGCCENPALPRDCAVSSAEEHLPYTQGVAGSNPAPRTMRSREGAVARMFPGDVMGTSGEAPSRDRPALRAGFRSAAGAARRARSGRGWGRGTRLPTAPGSGNRNSLLRLRRTAANSDSVLSSCERGAPFTLSPNRRLGAPAFRPAQPAGGGRNRALLSQIGRAGRSQRRPPHASLATDERAVSSCSPYCSMGAPTGCCPAVPSHLRARVQRDRRTLTSTGPVAHGKSDSATHFRSPA